VELGQLKVRIVEAVVLGGGKDIGGGGRIEMGKWADGVGGRVAFSNVFPKGFG